MMIRVDKLLVSGFVREDGENKMLARQANVATLFWMLFSSHAGKVMSMKSFRNLIKEWLFSKWYDNDLHALFGEDKTKDDLRVHGSACGKQGLKLDMLEINREKFLIFSLPNLIRCSRFLLGSGGRDTGSLCLNRLDTNAGIIGGSIMLEDLDDDSLIDALLDSSGKSSWENNFATSLDKKFREKGLSPGQRSKAIEVISERSGF